MPKVLIVDTYYDEALRSFDLSVAWDYEKALRYILDQHFGTADFVSDGFKRCGWEATDVIMNDARLRHRYLMPHGEYNRTSAEEFVLQVTRDTHLDVLYLQDVGAFSVETLRKLKALGVFLAAQHSCACQGKVDRLCECDVVFTSFPHFLDHSDPYIGMVNWSYLKIAFGQTITIQPRLYQTRSIEISFVGGLGYPCHWARGTAMLEAVAKHFGRRFRWHGYKGYDTPQALRDVWHGPAWGNQMYDIYANSRIVVNRHGEIANGYSNNMRMYEATGMGAVLITEASKNIHDIFAPHEVATYTDQDTLIERITYLLDHPDIAEKIAAAGCQRTLSEHTYVHRMQEVTHLLRRPPAGG